MENGRRGVTPTAPGKSSTCVLSDGIPIFAVFLAANRRRCLPLRLRSFKRNTTTRSDNNKNKRHSLSSVNTPKKRNNATLDSSSWNIRRG